MFKHGYIQRKLNIVFAENADPLNIVRAEFLVNSLLASSIIILIVLPNLYLNSLYLLFFRSIVSIFIQCALVWMLLNTKKWKIVAHGACLILVSLIVSNIFVSIQGIKIISLQFMLILILVSYYLLGTKWGIFYSSLSLLFMCWYFVLFGKNAMVLIEKQAIDNYIFIVVFIFNFLLIIYLQYHFFNAFNGTIKQLKIKQKKEKLLNEKLKEAIHSAEQLSKAKSNFLSTISHELRTPLNGVIGMSNILLLDNPRLDQKENLDVLKFSANNLLNLINDVLDINKIESGNMEIENIPFKIYDLTQHIYNSFKIKASQKGIQFNLDFNTDLKELYLIGDPTRLTQILTNLIENALKFTQVGSVNISITSKEKTNETIKLYFSISDTGIGIPQEKHNLIFESFSQASTSTTRNYGGSGLGLAIVKNLLILHQSKIKIQSEVNVGTSFSFEINYKVQQHTIGTHLDNDKKNIDISGLKILIAEDNEMNILFIRKLFMKWNMSPDFAENGSEAVEAFRTKQYDLILMDIHMPIMDGYEAARTIRNDTDSAKANVPIIALTASVALDVRNKIAEAGINDFISKPFSIEILKSKLENITTQKALANL